MDETLDVRLPPWFAIRNSALKGNSLKKIITYWNLIKLYSAQNGCGHVSIPYTTWLSVSLWRRVLSWDFLPITTYVPPIWSIKWKKIGSRKVCCMSNKNCPICNTCPICNSMFISLCTEQSINYFSQKLTFFFKLDKFQPLKKIFFRDFRWSAVLV